MMQRVGYLLRSDLDYIIDFYNIKIESISAAKSSTDNFDGLVELGIDAFNMQRYIDDMSHFGWPEITEKIGEYLEKTYKDKNIIKNIYNEIIAKIKNNFDGQRTIGENDYIIENKIFYYRSLKGAWYEISTEEIFLLLPTLSKKISPEKSSSLEAKYKPTSLDGIYCKWASADDLRSTLNNLLHFEEGTTTPEKYAQSVNTQIKNILSNPPSITAIEKNHDEGENYLESLIKISYKIINFVQPLRGGAKYPLYILRDGMMFSEAHSALDILTGNNFNHGEVMIGRKLLSTSTQPEFYWRLTVDVLYAALRKHPNNFASFEKEYYRLMADAEKKYPELSELFIRLADYLRKHVEAKAGSTLIMVDTGLQGSVNMLIKYLFDKHSRKNNKTDIFMFVVGDWFKGIYSGKYASDYYPMMKDIEILSRSENIYNYKPGSFEEGDLKVEMGDKNYQLKANIELIVLTTLCYIMQKSN